MRGVAEGSVLNGIIITICCMSLIGFKPLASYQLAVIEWEVYIENFYDARQFLRSN